ncbi:hypothetical protein EYF80_059583 [Liparis tanakae]|uniref:Uncharacterized protein n=1 Tax=Liparis tanakae TaxID=230148 RepID=A0A4Z2EP92_9TELE|nr:hypothetical protein EYF80_059583 [Liparis tanakae]
MTTRWDEGQERGSLGLDRQQNERKPFEDRQLHRQMSLQKPYLRLVPTGSYWFRVVPDCGAPTSL